MVPNSHNLDISFDSIILYTFVDIVLDVFIAFVNCFYDTTIGCVCDVRVKKRARGWERPKDFLVRLHSIWHPLFLSHSTCLLPMLIASNVFYVMYAEYW